MELGTYLAILRRRKWLIGLVVAAMVSVVAIGTLLTTPIYRAATKLRVLTATGGSVEWPQYNIPSAERLMNTYSDLVTGGPVLEELVQKLGLDESPQIDVEIIPNTELMKIVVEDPNPILASDAANALAAILVTQSTALYAGESGSAFEILSEQLAQIAEELEQAEGERGSLVAQSPQDEERIQAINRSIELKRETHAALLQQYAKARVSEAMRANALCVVEPATVPEKPSKPRKALNLVLGALVGLAGGVGVAFLLENLDNTLRLRLGRRMQAGVGDLAIAADRVLALPRLPRGKAAAWFAGARIRALPRWDLAATLALLVWMCALVYLQGFHQGFAGMDQAMHFFPAAQKLLDGQGYRAFEANVLHGPGYPLALALATKLLSCDMFAAGKVIAVASSVLFLLFAYLLIRRVFEPVTALAAVLLSMGVNTFTFVSAANSTDIPFACLALACLCFIARHDRPTGSDALWAGLLAGLALTVRWTGLVLPLFLLVRIILVPCRDLGLRSKGSIFVVHLLGFLVASGPWLYVNYQLHGSPLYTFGAIALDPDILSPSRSLVGALLQAVQKEPLDFGLRFTAKLFGSFPVAIQGLNSYPEEGGWVMAGSFWVLILIGLLFVLMRLDRLRLWFLLTAGIWWASLVPIHYESRFFMLLIPAFAALAVSVVTSGVLPDLRFALGGGHHVKATPGYVLGRLLGSRMPGWRSMNPAGTSLTSLVLIGLLAATAFSPVKWRRAGLDWQYRNADVYHELATYLQQSLGSEPHLPIGVRLCSEARYWIAQGSGTPVLPLPRQGYESVLTRLSFVLWDQLNVADTIWSWCDDPKVSALADPLHAPDSLEAIYYKPDSRRLILYRVLEHNKPAEIVAAQASSSLPQQPAPLAIDKNAHTWWASALRASADISESLTLDLASPQRINRVWLLPRPGGQAFPAGLRIDVSQDGTTWLSAIDARGLAQPERQDPRVFRFSETSARYVRITVTQLRWAEDEGGYLASLVEARVSLAVERPSQLPRFGIAPSDLFFDPLTNELVASVHSLGAAPGRATVEFSRGWSAEDSEHLGTVQSSIAEPGGVGHARLPFNESDRLQPDHCRPIWATIRPESCVACDVDAYGVPRPQPQTVYRLVCSPEEAVIDDFGYPESPLERGWVLPPEQTTAGYAVTTYDQGLGSRVMRVSSDAEDGFRIRRFMRVYDRPVMALRVKAQPNFLIYVRVVDQEGEWYYVQYMPFTWGHYPEEYPEGRYIYYPLGPHLADGNWHTIERNVSEDFAAKTGKEVDYIEALAFRIYGEFSLASPKLATDE
jgi:capsular polysaccharide biosynthesis protein/4-amino-4-deoxy-L-arabinose transferase-like glycosyltransferase